MAVVVKKEGNLVGWHFLATDRRLQYPPHVVVEPGQIVRFDPPVRLHGTGGLHIRLYERGLHASKRALDALKYAPGPIVCRVRLGGTMIEDEDRAVATRLTCLWMADATQVLHEFACWCAEQALLREREAGREPDPRSWAAIETKRRWLSGEATDEQLDAARDAAWAAAQDTALAIGGAKAWAMWAAAWTAQATAENVAEAAVRLAAEIAQAASTGDAMWPAQDAAEAAAWAAANERLEQMLMALAPATAEAAVG